MGILGFCMPWWEGREENLIKLCLPRLAAVGAGAWNRRGESDFAGFQARFAEGLPRLKKMADIAPYEMPFAEDSSQVGNLAFRAEVSTSQGEHQPYFSPARLTNGITDRFDHFLGFPTQPEPLEITIELLEAKEISRIEVFETAEGSSHELYELLLSSDGVVFEPLGRTNKDSRGDSNHVTHDFEKCVVSHIMIRTDGCHGLTFPSFSRLTEVRVFAD